MRLLKQLQRLPRVLIFLVVAPVLGCSDRPLYDELRRLCEEDGGVEIFNTVEARGYFSGQGTCYSCWSDIIDEDLDFIEYCNAKPRSNHPTSEPGCWRLYKISRASDQCNERIDKRLLMRRSSPYEDFSREHCIAAEKIEKPGARFGLFLEIEAWDMGDGKGSLMRRYVESFRDLHSHEVIAKEVNYTVSPDPSGHTQRVMTHGCPSVIDDFNYYHYLAKSVIRVANDISGRKGP